MNVGIFWVRAMKCMCAQSRPRFILSSERVFGEWSLNPCLLQGKNPSSGKFPQRRIEPATLWTGSPNTTNWAIAAPRPWFNSHFCHRSFCRSSHTTDLKTGTPVAILPGARRHRINVGTGWPCVSIRWLSKTKFDLQLLSQCGRTYSWLSKSVPEIR